MQEIQNRSLSSMKYLKINIKISESVDFIKSIEVSEFEYSEMPKLVGSSAMSRTGGIAISLQYKNKRWEVSPVSYTIHSGRATGRGDFQIGGNAILSINWGHGQNEDDINLRLYGLKLEYIAESLTMFIQDNIWIIERFLKRCGRGQQPSVLSFVDVPHLQEESKARKRAKFQAMTGLDVSWGHWSPDMKFKEIEESDKDSFIPVYSTWTGCAVSYHESKTFYWSNLRGRSEMYIGDKEQSHGSNYAHSPRPISLNGESIFRYSIPTWATHVGMIHEGCRSRNGSSFGLDVKIFNLKS